MKSRILHAGILLAFIAGAAAMAPLASFAMSSSANNAPLTPRTFVDLSKKALPSVVSIEVQRELEVLRGSMGRLRMNPNNPREMEDLLRRFFDMPGQPSIPGQPNQPEAPDDQPSPQPEDDSAYKYKTAGSGFIFHLDGEYAYVLTNNHVVDGAKDGDVGVILDPIFEDKKISGKDVEILDRDTLGDLAILKVKVGDTKVKALEWGDSDALEVGEMVLALGNPLELRNSVADGIIAAKHREINKSAIEDLIQTTAAINPGNSGGPLVNLDGQVVGINNAIATRTGLWQGVGFAIPSNYARSVAEQVVKSGKISRGYLGIEMGELKEDVARYFGLEKAGGVIVQAVHTDSAAEKAGVKQYDVIVAVDGKDVKSPAEMLRTIATKNAGAKVELTVWRESDDSEKKPQKMTLSAKLGERPSEDQLASTMGGPRSPAAAAASTTKLGLQLEAAGPADEIEGLKVKGVVRGGPGDKAGLREGDVILQVNRKEVKKLGDLAEALGKRAKGKDHLILYSRQGMNSFATLKAE